MLNCITQSHPIGFVKLTFQCCDLTSNCDLTFRGIFAKSSKRNESIQQSGNVLHTDEKLQYFYWENKFNFYKKKSIEKASMIQNKWNFLWRFWQLEAADCLQSLDQNHFIFGTNLENFHNTESSGLSNQSTHASNIVTCNNNNTQKIGISLTLRFNISSFIRTASNWPNGIAKIVGFHFIAWLRVLNIFQCQFIVSHFWVLWQRWNLLYFGWKWRKWISVFVSD